MWTIGAVLFAGLLGGLVALGQTDEQKFFFYWPTETTQCQIIDLTWANATPPFTAYIIPIFRSPFIYEIPDDAYSNGLGRYTIELQLQQGAYYTMFMSDGRGFGSGGSSEVQVVGASASTSCLNTISANATNQQFSFSPAGRARECYKGFDITWNGGPQDGPYNMSIIPLDQAFYPYEVELNKGGYDGDWQVNMTAGTRFTVMMNSARGYGRGGVAGIYEVDNSTRSDCNLQEPQPTGVWPRGLATNTLASSTNPPDEPSSSLSGGAIAGIVIGVLAFFALLGLILFFLLRRKRRRQALEDKERRAVAGGGGYQVDLGPRYEESVRAGGDEGTVDPFRADSYDLGDVEGASNGGGSSPNGLTSSSSAGLAGLGAAMGNATGTGTGAGTTAEPSRQAGPLSQKRTSLERETLRITNPANGTDIPTIPAGATFNESPLRDTRPRASHDRDRDRDRQRTFRRHEDAGRWRAPEHEEVVDLPPLYTDIRRDRDGASDGGQR